MNRRLFATAASVVLLEGFSAMAESAPIRSLEKISGRGFQAIQSVIDLLQRRRPELYDDRLDVLQAGQQEVVLLTPPPTPIGGRPIGALVQPPRDLTGDEMQLLLSRLGQMQSLGSLEARHYPVLQRGVTVFAQRGLDLGAYQIQLVSEGATLAVLFADRTREPGTKGSTGQPGFEVVFDAADLSVLRANFVR